MLLLFDQIRAIVLSVLLYVFICFMSFDILLLYIISIRKPLLDNKYFDFHRQHGFSKITILKVILALVLSYLLIDPPPNALYAIVPITFHCFFVMKLLIDFIRKDAGATSIKPSRGREPERP